MTSYYEIRVYHHRAHGAYHKCNFLNRVSLIQPPLQDPVFGDLIMAPLCPSAEPFIVRSGFNECRKIFRP